MPVLRIFNEFCRPLIPRLAEQIEFPHLGSDVVGQPFQTVEIHRLRDVRALAAPFLLRRDRTIRLRPGVHVEHRIHQLIPVGRGDGLVIAAQIGIPMLCAPGAQIPSSRPEHAVELGRKLPPRRRRHQIQVVVVELLHQFGRAVGAAQPHVASGPEVVPPFGGCVCHIREPDVGRGIEPAHGGGEHVLLWIEGGGGDNQDHRRTGVRREPDFTFIEDLSVFPARSQYGNRDRRLAAVVALAELLRQRHPLPHDLQLRDREMTAGLHPRKPQHAQPDLGTRPQHGDHVVGGPGDGTNGDPTSLDFQQAVIDRQMLPESRLRKNILAVLDVDMKPHPPQ